MARNRLAEEKLIQSLGRNATEAKRRMFDPKMSVVSLSWLEHGIHNPNTLKFLTIQT
jgi:hypothetical protein